MPRAVYDACCIADKDGRWHWEHQLTCHMQSQHTAAQWIPHLLHGGNIAGYGGLE